MLDHVKTTRELSGFADRPTFVRVYRELMGSRQVLLIFLIGISAAFVYHLYQTYQNPFDLERVTMYALYLVVNYGFFYFFLGRIAYLGHQWNIPTFWAAMIVIAVLNAGHSITAYFWNEQMAQAGVAARQVLRVTLLHVPPVAILFLVHGERLARRLADDPANYPWWRLLKRPAHSALAALGADLQGCPIRLEAEGNYVRITTGEGSELVRKTMKEAADILADQDGWRIHRSVWIAKSQAVAVVFDRGNPRLVDIEGRHWPMSRASAKTVKAELEAVV